ncbi:MAG: cytochrome P450 [Woeseiaceae bacterium]|nr:cytochrome P450 [Woeseiaceae bacterium]
MNLPASELRRPPGPEDILSPGVDADTLELLLDLKRRYGNVVRMRKPDGRDALFINDAADVRRLLVRRHENYRKGPGFERVKMLLGNGLIVSDGDTWRRSRTMVQPAFSKKNLHRLLETMLECCEQRAIRWQALANAGEAINITRETSDFALELILRSIFGHDYESAIVSDGNNPFAFLSQDSTRDLAVVLKIRELHELLLEIIARRRASAPTDAFDFLAAYLLARDKDGKEFSDGELLDELVTLIVAGYETSAGTLNWAWYLLAGHEEAQERLLDEANATLGTADSIDAGLLTQMNYAQQVLEETLRLYPPVWLFTRRAVREDSLSEFELAAGTDIYLSPYILHRSEDYWREASSFNPDRFAADRAYKKGERPYFPFSLGPRRCLGEYFSFVEMKIHLGQLVQKFRMTLPDDAEPGLDLGINLRSANDIWLKPELRRPA